MEGRREGHGLLFSLKVLYLQCLKNFVADCSLVIDLSFIDDYDPREL